MAKLLTNFEYEGLHNVRRTAERGLAMANSTKHGYGAGTEMRRAHGMYVDAFQHILDELERAGVK